MTGTVRMMVLAGGRRICRGGGRRRRRRMSRTGGGGPLGGGWLGAWPSLLRCCWACACLGLKAVACGCCRCRCVVGVYGNGGPCRRVARGSFSFFRGVCMYLQPASLSLSLSVGRSVRLRGEGGGGDQTTVLVCLKVEILVRRRSLIGPLIVALYVLCISILSPASEAPSWPARPFICDPRLLSLPQAFF